MSEQSIKPLALVALGLIAATLPAAGLAGGTDIANGKKIYNQTCIACHGPDGSGAMATVPDLTKPDGRLAKPTDVLLKHIREGFQSPGSPMAMPAKGGNPSLTEKDLEDVLAYMLKAFQ